jgi:hypothetical protein
MKIALILCPCECETLFQLSINHLWRDARLRASGLLMLSQGAHPIVIGRQCGVSHQTIYNWRHLGARRFGWPDQRACRRPAQKTERGMPRARTQALTLRGIVQ